LAIAPGRDSPGVSHLQPTRGSARAWSSAGPPADSVGGPRCLGPGPAPPHIAGDSEPALRYERPGGRVPRRPQDDRLAPRRLTRRIHKGGRAVSLFRRLSPVPKNRSTHVGVGEGLPQGRGPGLPPPDSGAPGPAERVAVI